MTTLVGLAAGGLIGALLYVLGHGLVSLDLVLAAGLVALPLLIFIRRRRLVSAPAPGAPADVPGPAGTPSRSATAGEAPGGASRLDRGVQDIRQADPGFDPSRFAGYAAMTFRDTQGVRMTRDVDSLRDRVTPEMRGRLQAQCDRVRSTGRAERVERIEIVAEITDAWQEHGRDYVTAHLGGSLVDYTIDEATDAVVAGSRTRPRSVEELWTFTRPSGLNFWMLAAVQAAGGDPTR